MNLAAALASSAGVSALAVIVFLVVGCISLAAYLAPGIVASWRKVPNQGSVWVINILLGWTLIGWGVALAMACRSKYQAIMTPYGQQPYGMYPPPPPPPGFQPPATRPPYYPPAATTDQYREPRDQS